MSEAVPEVQREAQAEEYVPDEQVGAMDPESAAGVVEDAAEATRGRAADDRPDPADADERIEDLPDEPDGR